MPKIIGYKVNNKIDLLYFCKMWFDPLQTKWLEAYLRSYDYLHLFSNGTFCTKRYDNCSMCYEKKCKYNKNHLGLYNGRLKKLNRILNS